MVNTAEDGPRLQVEGRFSSPILDGASFRLTRGVWRSSVARLLWEQEVPSSSLGTPTRQRPGCAERLGFRARRPRRANRLTTSGAYNPSAVCVLHRGKSSDELFPVTSVILPSARAAAFRVSHSSSKVGGAGVGVAVGCASVGVGVEPAGCGVGIGVGVGSAGVGVRSEAPHAGRSSRVNSATPRSNPHFRVIMPHYSRSSAVPLRCGDPACLPSGALRSTSWCSTCQLPSLVWTAWRLWSPRPERASSRRTPSSLRPE